MKRTTQTDAALDVAHKEGLLRLLARINASSDPAEALWQALEEEYFTGEAMGFSNATYQAEKVAAKPTAKQAKRLVAKLLRCNESASDDCDRARAKLDAIAPVAPVVD